LRLGIGDDMALLTGRAGHFLLSSDMLLDGVHFDTRTHPLPRIGRKAVACCLSDCAAMAVRPLAVTVSVALPHDWPMSKAQALYEGVFDIAAEFGVAIAGGDTTRWPHPLAVDLAVVAEPHPRVEPITRAGARVGDCLYVTGPLGGSLLGRHLDFIPRVREARQLAESLGDRLHAMIDISDGLSLDLWRICQASGVGAVLEEPLLEAVVSDAATAMSKRDGRTPLGHVLSDGEDFELLFAAADDAPSMPVPTWPIGSVVESGLSLQRADGVVVGLEPKGYVH
jgi:thiamine-monophosphate kinase